MANKKVTVMYFSPSGTTKKTLEAIVEGMGITDVNYINLTDFDTRWQWRTFNEDDLVIIGMPVYEGRLVVTAKEVFNRTSAVNTPMVGVVTYGNRAYEDALLELSDLAKANDFNMFAGGAFIAQHPLNEHVGTGRPDANDHKKLHKFGADIMEKYGSTTLSKIKVPGNTPYKMTSDLPLSPTANESCTECGECLEVCPMKAIDPNKPSRTDNFRCILCSNCVKACPENARAVMHEKYQLMTKALVSLAAGRKEPETYL